MDFNEVVEKLKALEASVMELQKDKIGREAVEKYKKERFARWKDIALVACAVISAAVTVAVSVFGLGKA